MKNIYLWYPSVKSIYKVMKNR